MEKVADYKPCIDCGTMGYTDERIFSKDKNGYLCVRCSRPDINWAGAKTWKVDES